MVSASRCESSCVGRVSETAGQQHAVSYRQRAYWAYHQKSVHSQPHTRVHIALTDCMTWAWGQPPVLHVRNTDENTAIHQRPPYIKGCYTHLHPAIPEQHWGVLGAPQPQRPAGARRPGARNWAGNWAGNWARNWARVEQPPPAGTPAAAAQAATCCSRRLKASLRPRC